MAPGCGFQNPNHSRLTGKQGPVGIVPPTDDEILADIMRVGQVQITGKEVEHTAEMEQKVQSTFPKIKTFFDTEQEVPLCLVCGIPAVMRVKLTCVLKFSCKCDNCKFEKYYEKEEVWGKWRFDLATGEQSKGEGCKKKQMVCKKGSCKCAHCNKSNGQYLTKGFKVEVYNGVEGKSGAGDKKKPAGLDAFGFATKKK